MDRYEFNRCRVLCTKYTAPVKFHKHFRILTQLLALVLKEC